MKTASDLLFLLAGVCWAIELGPQIYKSWRTKRVDDLSLPFFLICLMGYACFIVASILIRNWALLISHIAGVSSTILMVVLILMYKEGGRNARQD